MLSLPSLQNEYTLVFSGDPALDLPEVPDLDREKASPEEIAAADAVIKERNRKLKVARETGDWGAITKAGQKPTLFTMHQVHGQMLSWFSGEVDRERMNDVEGLELMCRLALKSATNCGTFVVKLDPKSGNKPQLVSAATMALLYGFASDEDPRLGRKLVMELGAIAHERAWSGVGPLS